MESFRSYLPSKFFGLILGAIALVVLLVFLAETWPKEEKKSNNSLIVSKERANETLSAIVKIAADKDTDGDGLKDWEETLWKTNPANSDSDGDGTPDGEEIKRGRNPAIKGPGDTLSKNEIGGEDISKNPSGERENLTTTEILSRDVLSQYLLAKQSNADLDEETIMQIVTSTLSRPEYKKSPRVYLKGDINIISDSSSSTLRAYGNEVGEIIKKHARWEESEIDIIYRALEKSDEEEIKKLEPIAESYKKIMDEMLIVKVPEGLAQIHLALLNGFSGMYSVVYGSLVIFSDPASAIISFAKITESGYALYEAFKNASTFFDKQGISYGENEGGFVLVNFSKAIDEINSK